MHRQVLGVAGAAALGLGLAPGTAAAHTVRVLRVVHVSEHTRAGAPQASGVASADLAALNAYDKYLAALQADASSSADRASLIVTGVEAKCANAVSDLNDLSAGQVEKKALSAFGDEVDANLDLAYMAPTRTALTKLASALDAITWPTAAEAKIPSQLIDSERTLMAVPESNICGDANKLDAAPLSEPTATVRFLKRYRAANKNLQSALTAFQALLSEYETPSETNLISQIDTLVDSFSGQSTSTEQTDATTVLSELGISSSSSS